MESGLLSDADDCGRALLRLLSRGHAVAAELQRVADALPPVLMGEGPEAKRLAPVLPDFAVFRSEGAVERVAASPELMELDAESQELHDRFARRTFRLLAAVRKYAGDLERFLRDLEAGAYVSHSLEGVLRDLDGAQLVSEAVALLGAILLILDQRLPGLARERALVMFYRFTVGTSDAADDFPDVCRMFKGTGRPPDADLAARSAGYPEAYFQRFPLPRDAIRMIIGQLQMGDIYEAGRHYSLAEHRSHSLSAQAGLLYTVLFFDVATLKSDVPAMREIVNRHFADAWVVAYALGFTADLLAMWAPYTAARESLGSVITPASVKQLCETHAQRLGETRQQLAEYLVEGALTQEIAMTRTSALLSCLRQANTTIRWLLLQATTQDARLQAVFKSCPVPKEQLLQALVDTALLEDRVRNILEPLVARREATWAEQRAAAAQNMDDLAVYFSGKHALRRNVRNEDLEAWFRDMQERIDNLAFDSQKDTLLLGRKVADLVRGLEQVQDYHEISQQRQILHFISDARALLQSMVHTVNLNEQTLHTISTVADLSYAWKALGAYEQTMHALLAQSPDSVKGLRALFLKLVSILQAPLRRIRQAGNSAHYELVSGYYSARLVQFMRSTLQEIPRLLFGLLGRVSEQTAAKPDRFGSRIALVELSEYAKLSEAARHEVGTLTQRVTLLMRGMCETEVAVLGQIHVDPRAVLVDGLRRELARHIEALLAGLVFPPSGRSVSRADVDSPISSLAKKVEDLCSGFEHVQDYLGVSALQLWHQELGRVVAFFLHVEQHVLLRRRVPPAAACPHHDPSAPITFPDHGAKGASAVSSGGSFISRVAEALLTVTNPQIVVGGLQSEWRLASSGEVVIDGYAFEMLHRALGPSGLTAVSRYLGLLAAIRIKKVFEGASALLTPQTQEQLGKVVATARGAGGDADSASLLRRAAQRVLTTTTPMVSALAVVGQHQLLRRRLHNSLRLHARLDAPLILESLCSVDGAGLLEASQLPAADDDANLPSVFDFVGGGGPSLDELLGRFHRRVAKAGERAGLGDPLRQLYTIIPEGAAFKGLDTFLALALITFAATDGSRSGASAGKRRSGWFSRSDHSAAAATVTAAEEAAKRGEEVAAVVAGLATLLQQLPRSRTDGLLSVLGVYLGGLCTKSAAGKEAWAEGAGLISLLETLLDLLGLPRAHLAGFVPQGLLDLWPAAE